MAYRHPTTEHKEAYVTELFDQIAENYDKMNLVMSVGQWRLWHRRFAELTGLEPGMQSLDIACGTGDLSLLSAAQVAPTGRVIGVDISEGMLAVGRRRVAESPYADLIELRLGNALELPFPDQSFDVVTMGWAMRNVPDIPKVLSEAYRVLKPGGRFISMDAARPSNALLRAGFAVWWKVFVPLIDRFVVKVEKGASVQPYRYLASSLDQHPSPGALRDLFVAAGFTGADYRLMGLQAASIHYGQKP